MSSEFDDDHVVIFEWLFLHHVDDMLVWLVELFFVGVCVLHQFLVSLHLLWLVHQYLDHIR